jgi:ferredoxin--NADP+ reductase
MRFLTSPIEMIGEDGHVTCVKVERNRLVLDKRGGLRAQGTGVHDIIEAGLVLRSVGYRGVPLPGVPFEEGTFIIPNINGRVIGVHDGEPIPGEYVVGWAKRGPSGVIGTNKPDAVATVASMVEDVPTLQGILDQNRDPERIVALLRARKLEFVTYADWKRLDAYETSLGAAQGRPRIKVTTVPEMLEVINSHKS